MCCFLNFGSKSKECCVCPYSLRLNRHPFFGGLFHSCVFTPLLMRAFFAAASLTAVWASEPDVLSDDSLSLLQTAAARHPALSMLNTHKKTMPPPQPGTFMEIWIPSPSVPLWKSMTTCRTMMRQLSLERSSRGTAMRTLLVIGCSLVSSTTTLATRVLTVDQREFAMAMSCS